MSMHTAKLPLRHALAAFRHFRIGYALIFALQSGIASEWIILHFLQRKKAPKNISELPKGVWNIIFEEEDFKRATIIPSNNNVDFSDEYYIKGKDQKGEPFDFKIKGNHGNAQQVLLIGDFLGDNQDHPIQLTLQLIHIDPKLGLQIKKVQFRECSSFD